MMTKIKHWLLGNYKLLLLGLLLAIIGHSYFLSNQLIDNQYMMGTHDQFSQMIIFKDLLYDEFTQGNFFYSFYLNGGGNLISRLSYYFSTSLVFYATALVTFLLEVTNIIQAPDMVYWANLATIISVFRSAVILFATTKFIQVFTKNQKIALLGATFYTFSSIYFRHATLWEFFADAMIWLPIILLGVEYIIRKKDGKVFTLGVALTLFNNGYFAFANLLFTSIYILLRFLFKLSQKEQPLIKQLKSYLTYGLLGLGLSLPGFIPFVKGFFNTSRLSPEFSIPALELTAFDLGDLLLTDRIQLLPILFILVVTYGRNYRSKHFRFFSVFSFILIVLRYNPFVASLFNGLSYPQNRWHYATFLMVGVVIALGVKQMIRDMQKNLKMSSLYLGLAAVSTLFIYTLADGQTESHYFNMSLVYGVILVLALSFYFARVKAVKSEYFILPIIFTGSLYTFFVTNQQLYDNYNLETMDYDLIYETFEDPNHPYERALDVIKADSERFHRIDFTDMRNLGSQKDFSTFNVYNSFQNHYQQYFYRYFQINNSRENNGTIDGLAGRQILSSLFQSDYVIASEANAYIIPTGFEPIDQVEDLGIYKNTIPLAFIHPVQHLYSADEVDEYHFKDELLINGAIVEEELNNRPLEEAPEPNELAYEVTAIGTERENNRLVQSEDYFDIDLVIEDQDQVYDDVVIDYTIKPLDEGETGRYTYSINGHSIQLKSTGDPYSSQLYRHQVHLPYNEEIRFHLAPGTDYEFEIHAIYGVSHEPLIARSQNDEGLDYEVAINQGEVDIQFNNTEGYPLMVLPLFYENGWLLEINGKKRDVLNVNNGMVGFEIPEGEMTIHLTFRQPFLYTTLLLSILSFFMLVYIEQGKTKRRS